jgi:outer membrane receptor protein involved in Fe transport
MLELVPWQRGALLAMLSATAGLAHAEVGPDDSSVGIDSTDVTMTGQRTKTAREDFPATTASVSQEQLQDTVNGVDVEDTKVSTARRRAYAPDRVA